MEYGNGSFYGGTPNGGYAPWYGDGNNFDAMVARENLRRAAVRDLRRNSRAVSGALVAFLVLPIGLSLLLSFLDLLNEYFDNSTFRGCTDIVFSIISVFLPFFVVYLILQRNSAGRWDLPLGKPSSGHLMLFAVFAGWMLCIVSSYISDFFTSTVEQTGVEFSMPEVETDFTSIPSTLLAIVQTALVPALSEEFAFRGVVMQPLRRYGDRFALLVSAILFSLMHGNMIQIPFSFLAGLVIGYFVIATDSMWTGILIHFLNNFTATIIQAVYANHPATADKLYTAIIWVIMMLGGAAIVLFIFSKKKRPMLREQVYTGMTGGKKARTYFFTVPMIIALCFLIYSISYYVDF